jgi:hypothetical protein
VAANPDVGSARYALRGVLRVLLRVVVLTGMIVAGWLLGSGLSHADEDPGLPGAGVLHAVSTGSSGTTSSARFDVPGTAKPTVAKLLSATSGPRLPIKPAEKLGILRPVVHVVGKAAPLTKSLTKPLAGPVTELLSPVPKPLFGPASHASAVHPATSADKAAPASPAAPTMASPAAPTMATAAVPSSAAALTPVRHASPTRVHCSPGVNAVPPALGQQLLPDSGPIDPAPASPPGNTPSCMVGSASSGASTKNAPDFAIHGSAMADNRVQPDGALQLSGSDLPRSLAVKPSTSPD